jgi:hypothetical protein
LAGDSFWRFYRVITGANRLDWPTFTAQLRELGYELGVHEPPGPCVIGFEANGTAIIYSLGVNHSDVGATTIPPRAYVDAIHSHLAEHVGNVQHLTRRHGFRTMRPSEVPSPGESRSVPDEGVLGNVFLIAGLMLAIVNLPWAFELVPQWRSQAFDLGWPAWLYYVITAACGASWAAWVVKRNKWALRRSGRVALSISVATIGIGELGALVTVAHVLDRLGIGSWFVLTKNNPLPVLVEAIGAAPGALLGLYLLDRLKR